MFERQECVGCLEIAVNIFSFLYDNICTVRANNEKYVSEYIYLPNWAADQESGQIVPIGVIFQDMLDEAGRQRISTHVSPCNAGATRIAVPLAGTASDGTYHHCGRLLTMMVRALALA